MPERIIKYGGVKIRNLVPPVKINRYVNSLPPARKESLFEIASELNQAGLIDILNDRTHSTIDEDTVDDQLVNEDIPNVGYKRKLTPSELGNPNKLS